ncbi:hypothetical protein POM88_008554 [Heracleum sosnowskyi]|uniref:YTH domain-containing family protein n=1 Tax=Heracleum sosnowskyi TaxID=360622 RepID=A0AAD8J7M1_9APIA|nr:hypothetical protein POM88_008554 [Heracleum sosnowskyi]
MRATHYGRGTQIVDNLSHGKVWSNRNQVKVSQPGNVLSSFGASVQRRTVMDKVQTLFNVGHGIPDVSYQQNRGPRRLEQVINKNIGWRSEDDVHKSIKYNVWSSTPNGNKKLNIAYDDARRIAGEDPKGCPIFLFFSVRLVICFLF